MPGLFRDSSFPDSGGKFLPPQRSPSPAHTRYYLHPFQGDALEPLQGFNIWPASSLFSHDSRSLTLPGAPDTVNLPRNLENDSVRWLKAR
jgi:hypothetical protein